MAGDQDVESFVRLVEALRPQLDSIVFAGGWAHRLHRLHPLAQPIQYAPLMTRDADIAVHIPNAAAYLAQKILIHEKRNREKRARDLLYLHDTIETFGRSFEQLRGEWQDHVRPQLHPRAAAVVENSAAVLFSGVTDDIRNAAIQAGAAGRMLNPETVRRVGEAGLTAIFK